MLTRLMSGLSSQMCGGLSATGEKLWHQMVRLLVLLILWPHVVAHQLDNTGCPTNSPLPVPHEWYQPGKLVIGEVVSQIIYIFHEASFTKPPSQELGFELPM